MKAGVIGTNWGRVHVHGLRKAGCEVTAIVSHDASIAQKIADDENIPYSGDSIQLLDDCDIVAIATPTHTHLNYLSAFHDKIILCEKPLGITPENIHQFQALKNEHIYISYPYPFVNTAKQIQQFIEAGSLGELVRITAIAGVNLPYPKSPREWFIEDMIHPYSLLTHLFGEMSFIQAYQGSGCNISAQMQCHNALVDLLLCPWPTQGIHFDITLIGSLNTIQLRGGFRPDRHWWMEPLMIDDVSTGVGDLASDNIWINACHTVAQTVVDVESGKQSRQSAEKIGLFPLKRALKMEETLMPLWKSLASYPQTPTLAGDIHWQLK